MSRGRETQTGKVEPRPQAWKGVGPKGQGFALGVRMHCPWCAHKHKLELGKQ